LWYARVSNSTCVIASRGFAVETREEIGLNPKRSQRRSKEPKPIIGWREWVALPQLGILHIKPKIDTGARSSSLHVSEVEEFTRGDRAFVRFKVHPIQRNTDFGVQAEAEVLEYRNVRSSSGQKSLRPVILTEIRVLGQTWPIELTLANRDAMGFRMLLGREAIRGRFLVDAGKSYYGGKPLAKRKIKPRKAGTRDHLSKAGRAGRRTRQEEE
jgi:hypothetical protein